MAELASVPEFRTTASRCGRAIAWLHDHGVTDRRLADAFDTTPGNIRVICYRTHHEDVLGNPRTQIGRPDLTPPADTNSAVLRASSRIRLDADVTIPSGKATRKLEDLDAAIEETAADFRTNYRFIEGAAALKSFLPQIGYPSDIRRIRLLSKLRQERTWFLVHSGLSLSSVYEARKVMALSTIAFRESEDPSDLVLVGNAALVASNACLLRNDSDSALQFLSIVKQSFEAGRIRTGSEYYRQMGTVYFLDRNRAYDDLASITLLKAMDLMQELGEAKNPAQVSMVGTRKQILINRDWDLAHEFVSEMQRTFTAGSLEYSMNVHWAAACGLLTGSRTIEQQALELLETNRATAHLFGHQATISKLLSITPSLDLSPGARASWVRRALYENAFRNQ